MKKTPHTNVPKISPTISRLYIYPRPLGIMFNIDQASQRMVRSALTKTLLKVTHYI